MTEQEIVDYLKQNRTKGVAFGFMPKEVQEWCKNNSCKLIYYQPNDLWNRNSAKEYLFVSNEIVALPEDFDLVPKSEGGWVEFEIEPYKDKAYRFSADNRAFSWFDWQYFLQYSLDCNLCFTAFGGWKYKNIDNWFTNPQLEDSDGSVCDGYDDNDKPLIPAKIRFWREK